MAKRSRSIQKVDMLFYEQIDETDNKNAKH